jgi:hypothetical protein
MPALLTPDAIMVECVSSAAPAAQAVPAWHAEAQSLRVIVMIMFHTQHVMRTIVPAAMVV